jgi:hypothetical protein
MPAGSYTNGLAPTDIDDLVELTLNHFEKDKWTDISTELQRYFAYENMLLGDRIGVDGGERLQWQVKVRNTGGARNTGLYAVDDVRVADNMKNCQIGWTKQTASMAYDIDEEGFNSPDAVRIVNLLSTRRHDALTSFAELMEDNFWGLPSNTTDEEELKKPFGVPYWITRNSTLGFNGSLPIGGGHSTVAGLSPTTYTRWRNFSGSFRVIDKRDFVRKLREATVKCDFKQPVSQPSPSGSGKPRYILATTYEVIQRLEELLEAQNDNLGNDIASKDGDVMFRKQPVTWVPWLDANQDTTAADANNHYGKNPIYGIDRKSFRMVFKTGKFMQRSKPLVAPNQHSVRHVHWDSWCQFQCFDRRRNFLLTQLA